MMYMTKVWRFMAPHGPLQFSEPGWRDGSRDKFKPGDLVAMVGTKDAPTPPEKRGRLLGLVEPTREICTVRDFGLNNPNIAIAEDFNPDGTQTALWIADPASLALFAASIIERNI